MDKNMNILILGMFLIIAVIIIFGPQETMLKDSTIKEIKLKEIQVDSLKWEFKIDSLKTVNGED